VALLKLNRLFVLLLLFSHLLSAVPVKTAKLQNGDCELSYSYEKFPSNGKQIGIEFYSPANGNSLPPIVFIHGTAGLLSRTDSSVPANENFGEKTLACSGYVVALIHYMDSSGMVSVSRRDVIEQNADLWFRTLRDGISVVLSRVRGSNRVGLIGESLGAYLAIVLGATDARVAAISEISGGIDQSRIPDRALLPPLLIQHGEADSIVPVSEAYRLEQLYQQEGWPYEIHIYPGMHHALTGKPREQVLSSTIDFFERYLRQK
jgi:carboxymethylenebutenolidase